MAATKGLRSVILHIDLFAGEYHSISLLYPRLNPIYIFVYMATGTQFFLTIDHQISSRPYSSSGMICYGCYIGATWNVSGNHQLVG